MRKIPTIFQRDLQTHRVTEQVTPGCEWVFSEDVLVTEKIDGQAARIDKGEIWKRYDLPLKPEYRKLPHPPLEGYQPVLYAEVAGWVPAQPVPDQLTGHWPGWLQVHQDAPEDQWFREGFAWWKEQTVWESLAPGRTYELVGPKVQSNPYRLPGHQLWPHGEIILKEYGPLTPRIMFDLMSLHIEGVVIYNRDWSRQAKLKRRDYGLEWPVKG